jgi:hypothetical protein
MSVIATSIDLMHVSKSHSVNMTLILVIKTTGGMHGFIQQPRRSAVCFMDSVHVTQTTEAYISSK